MASESRLIREKAFQILESNIYAALETYSNVHRGAGHFSQATTHLFELARQVILDALHLDGERFTVIFCTPLRLKALKNLTKPTHYHVLSSQDFGLPLGIRALAMEKSSLPGGAPFQTGGGTVKLVSPSWVIWADAPDRFEAGTPAIINSIALARAVQISHKLGSEVFEKDCHVTAGVEEILFHDEFNGLTGLDLLRQLRQALIGREIMTPTAHGPRRFTNLDNGASTPTFIPVWEAFCKTWRQPLEIQTKIVEAVKGLCADFLGAPQDDYEILFASNTTEALNIAAGFLPDLAQDNCHPVVLNSLLEHHSNDLPWRYLDNVSLMRLPVDKEGFIDLVQLEKTLREHNHDCIYENRRVRLVSISGASNVLGTFNDIHVISHITHRYGARLMIDGAQLFAHHQINMKAWDIDYLAFSAHKAYAPFGSGGLVVRKHCLPDDPARLNDIKASAEENAAGIAALGKTIQLLMRISMDVVEEEERRITLHALRNLEKIDGIEIFGVNDPDSVRISRRGSTITLSLKHVPHNLAARMLAELGGIGVRNGCFCAHLLVKHLMHIHPIRARLADLGSLLLPELTSSLLPGLIRISFGLENDEGDVEHLIQVIQEINHIPMSKINRFAAWTYNGTPFLPNSETAKQIEMFVEATAQRVYSPITLD